MENRLFIALLLFLSMNIFSQVTPVLIGNKLKTNQKIKVIGSPYQQENFVAAKVSKIDQNTFMRYNIFEDQFEFISTKKDTLVLDKIKDFGTIDFIGSQTKYQLNTYTDAKEKLFYGYLINVYQNKNYGLYKKENITFSEQKEARTSLETTMPAKYSKNSDVFYFRNKESGITELPSNKNKFIKLFLNQKSSLEKFFKENKINFNDENDLKKVIDFLDSL